MPSDESKGSQLDAIGSLAQRQLDNTDLELPLASSASRRLGETASARQNAVSLPALTP